MTRSSSGRTFAAAVLSGLLFSAAFPPREWVLLLPLALVPWILALSGEERRGRALLSGVLFGLAYWCASIPWIVYVVTHYGGQSLPMGVVCLVLLAAILSQWPAVVAWGTVAIAPAGSWKRLAAFPLLWTASEHARSYVYGGFPWNLAGHALYRHPVWIQTAAFWGVYGVGFLAMATSSLLAAAIGRRRLSFVGGAALLVLAAGLAGAGRLAMAPPRGVSLSVALLQPNVSQQSRLAPASGATNYRAVIEQARNAAAAKPGLLVLPESAFPVYWDGSATLRRDVPEIARLADGLVLFNDVSEEETGLYYNVARLAGAAGLIGEPYRKVHLVPFGEYVPLPKIFFFVRQASSEIGAFSAAPAPSPLRSRPLSVGMGICYEILYPSLSREQVAAGANLLATISNDSWYGKAGAQPQHFAGAVLRAVENERYLLRAAITGISGIVDEKGRVRQELGEDERGTLTSKVLLLSGQTVWTRWGFLLPILCDAAAAAVLLSGLARWLRTKKREPAAENRQP